MTWCLLRTCIGRKSWGCLWCTSLKEGAGGGPGLPLLDEYLVLIMDMLRVPPPPPPAGLPLLDNIIIGALRGPQRSLGTGPAIQIERPRGPLTEYFCKNLQKPAKNASGRPQWVQPFRYTTPLNRCAWFGQEALNRTIHFCLSPNFSKPFKRALARPPA